MHTEYRVTSIRYKIFNRMTRAQAKLKLNDGTISRLFVIVIVFRCAQMLEHLAACTGFIMNSNGTSILRFPSGARHKLMPELSTRN